MRGRQAIEEFNYEYVLKSGFTLYFTSYIYDFSYTYPQTEGALGVISLLMFFPTTGKLLNGF